MKRPSTLARFRRDARRLAKRVTRKLTHGADLSLTITVSLPPFLKVTMIYKIAPSKTEARSEVESQ